MKFLWATILCPSMLQIGCYNIKLRHHDIFKITTFFLLEMYCVGRTHVYNMFIEHHLVKIPTSYVVLALHLKACNHTIFIFNVPWFGLLISFKGPQNFMVEYFLPKSLDPSHCIWEWVDIHINTHTYIYNKVALTFPLLGPFYTRTWGPWLLQSRIYEDSFILHYTRPWGPKGLQKLKRWKPYI